MQFTSNRPASAPVAPSTPWGAFAREETSEFIKLIMSNEPGPKFKKIAVTGRRRAGKTFTIRAAAFQCHRKGRYVLFVPASGTRETFIETFRDSLRLTIPGIQLPTTVKKIANCISWLLDNEISVIIDEFQNLRLHCPDLMFGLKVSFD